MKMLICPIVLDEAGHRKEDGCHISTGFEEAPSRKDASMNLWVCYFRAWEPLVQTSSRRIGPTVA